MGYAKAKMKPHDPVIWVEEESDYTHPWSLKRRAYEYGFYRLKELMELKDFFNMEADMFQTISDGIREGAAARLKVDEEQRKEAERLARQEAERNGVDVKK